MCPYQEDQIWLGDCRELIRAVPDAWVNAIFTDPPYEDECAWCWEWLSIEGARVLKPGGFLVTYAGKHALPEVYAGLSSHLTYWWTFAGIQLDGSSRLWSKHLFSAWRPLLVYVKPPVPVTPWMPDARTTNRDKNHHKWGQGQDLVAFYMERMTQPGDLILEPFCGGGTVPAVAKTLGRRYLAFEVLPEAYEEARKRLANLPEPLLMTEPAGEQLVMRDL
jgi:hypothetical protein